MQMIKVKKILIKLFDNDFTVRSRKRHNVYQRAIYFKLCEDFALGSLTDIGNSVGLDHCSVIHSRKIFNNLRFWREEELLTLYDNAKHIISTINKNEKLYNKTYRQRYRELLHRHITLKEKYHNLKTTKEKIS